MTAREYYKKKFGVEPKEGAQFLMSLKEVLDLQDELLSAQEQVENLNLGVVSNSVFIVCENDDYGRDLYLCTENTIEEAKAIKGNDNTRNIYEYEVLETDC